jgi:Ca2+-binding RTX toxin-like protein
MAIIDGTEHNDYLYGTLGADTINAFGEMDFIYGSSGEDTVHGGAGTDYLTFVISNPDRVTAPAGPTSYVIGADNVTASGAGIDTDFTGVEGIRISTANTGGFNDSLDASGFTGAQGVVWFSSGGTLDLVGSGQDDQFELGGGNVTLDGGAGTDFVTFGVSSETQNVSTSSNAGVLTVTTDAGDSLELSNVERVHVYSVGNNAPFNVDMSAATMSVSLSGGSFADTLVGGSGDDEFRLSAGGDTLTGGSGLDRFTISSLTQNVPDEVTITDFAVGELIEFMTASWRDGIVTTFVGTAAFSGVAGQVRYGFASGTTVAQIDVDGDSGADITLTLASGEFHLRHLWGGALEIIESIDGTAGDDLLVGTQLDDIVNGFGGVDTIVGRGGNDRLYGDGGSDVLRGQDGDDMLWGGFGHDDLFGGAGADTLQGDGGNDRVYGNAGDDFVNGGAGDDNVFGGAGNDRVFGGNGADIVNGHAGDDMIVGGPGSDLLVGGLGADRFLFNEGHLGSGLSSTDRIKDFSQAQGDVIDFRPLDADSTAAGDQAFTWIGNAAFGGTAGELRTEIVGNTTYVYGDRDGDGTADFALWLTGQIGLTEGDFVL